MSRRRQLQVASILWRPAELVIRFTDGNTRAAELCERRSDAGTWRASLVLRDLRTDTSVQRRAAGKVGPMLERLAERLGDLWLDVEAAQEFERLAMLEQVQGADEDVVPTVERSRPSKTAVRRASRRRPVAAAA